MSLGGLNGLAMSERERRCTASGYPTPHGGCATAPPLRRWPTWSATCRNAWAGTTPATSNQRSTSTAPLSAFRTRR